MVLGATSKIKSNMLNIEETYNWLRKLKVVNESYRNIIIDDSDVMLQRMIGVRDRLSSPQSVLSVDHPLDVYIDRTLDGSSNNNGTDYDGIRFRGQRVNNVQSTNITENTEVESDTFLPTTNSHGNINQEMADTIMTHPQNNENYEGKKYLNDHYIFSSFNKTFMDVYSQIKIQRGCQ